MLALFFGIVMVLFCVKFYLAGLLRLQIPLLYVLLVPTVFSGWYHAHQTLAEGIWYGMLVLVAVSWVVTIVHRM